MLTRWIFSYGKEEQVSIDVSPADNNYIEESLGDYHVNKKSILSFLSFPIGNNKIVINLNLVKTMVRQEIEEKKEETYEKAPEEAPCKTDDTSVLPNSN